MKITHLDVHAAHQQLLDNPEITVLDLRTAEEFEMYYIKGAHNIDALEDCFPQEIDELDKEKTYLIHCHAGGRSLKALDTFKTQGFAHILHMDGGMREWTHAKLPSVS